MLLHLVTGDLKWREWLWADIYGHSKILMPSNENDVITASSTIINILQVECVEFNLEKLHACIMALF